MTEIWQCKIRSLIKVRHFREFSDLKSVIESHPNSSYVYLKTHTKGTPDQIRSAIAQVKENKKKFRNDMCPPNLPLQNSLMDTNIGGSVGKSVGHPVSKMSPGSLEQPVFRGRVGNIGIFDFFIFFTSPDKSSYQIQLTNGRKLFRSYHEFCAFVQQTHQVQYHTIFDNNKEWICAR